ncbi:fatty acid desaturase-domain-containing protein [Phycomyces nitens]|nr:fatty acid desaturase-domain-containing protein [Phycomyces nitens]
MPPNVEARNEKVDDLKYITAQELQDGIKQGDALFIYEAKVYKVNRFMASHPGGDLAIRHSIGRDVTDEIRSLHPPAVYERMIHHFYVGEYVPDIKATNQAAKAPITKETMMTSWEGGISVQAFDDEIQQLHDQHAKDLSKDQIDQNNLDMLTIRKHFRQLEQEIKDRGLFECNRWRYGKEVCRYLLFLYISLWFTLAGSETWHYMVGACFMAFFWHQLVFSAHDAGHNEITGRLEIDHLIGVGIANFIGGLSIGWWKDSHNVHHIVTNHPEHDPDIQHMPFMAITTKLFNNLYSTYYNRVMEFDAPSRFFIKYQHYLYYIILSFGRFNLHVLSFTYLFSSKNVRNRKLELFGIAFFFLWYGALLSTLPSWGIVFAYIMVSYMLTFPLHVQITLSHFGMSTYDGGPNESFAAKMLRTTMDVDCPEWLDWFHGGLQYQAVHHLFPRIPRHNLRLCVPLVKEFCKQTGLHYYMYNFSTGNGVILGALKSVADQVVLMNDVAKYNAGVWNDEKAAVNK